MGLWDNLSKRGTSSSRDTSWPKEVQVKVNLMRESHMQADVDLGVRHRPIITQA